MKIEQYALTGSFGARFFSRLFVLKHYRSFRGTGHLPDAPVLRNHASRLFKTETIRLRVRALKARFRDQKTELRVIRRHLAPGDIACDIGAYKGSFSYWLARWCRHGKVIAFEPQPELARRLASACRTLGLCNVKVEARAVWSQSGIMNLFVPSASPSYLSGASLIRESSGETDFETLSVPAISLDEYFNRHHKLAEHDRIGALKIDAEGAELEILKGAEKILLRHAPLLVFECENRHLAQGDVRDVFSYLESLGYDGSFVRRNQLVPISEFDAAIHQRREDGERSWKSKDYCNNFVFRRRPPGQQNGMG